MLSWQKRSQVLDKAQADLDAARAIHRGSEQLLQDIRKDLKDIIPLLKPNGRPAVAVNGPADDRLK